MFLPRGVQPGTHRITTVYMWIFHFLYLLVPEELKEPWTHLVVSGWEAECTLNRLPGHHRKTGTSIHAHISWQLRGDSKPYFHIFRMWEEVILRKKKVVWLGCEPKTSFFLPNNRSAKSERCYWKTVFCTCSGYLCYLILLTKTC